MKFVENFKENFLFMWRKHPMAFFIMPLWVGFTYVCSSNRFDISTFGTVILTGLLFGWVCIVGAGLIFSFTQMFDKK